MLKEARRLVRAVRAAGDSGSVSENKDFHK